MLVLALGILSAVVTLPFCTTLGQLAGDSGQHPEVQTYTLLLSSACFMVIDCLLALLCAFQYTCINDIFTDDANSLMALTVVESANSLGTSHHTAKHHTLIVTTDD